MASNVVYSVLRPAVELYNFFKILHYYFKNILRGNGDHRYMLSSADYNKNFNFSGALSIHCCSHCPRFTCIFCTTCHYGRYRLILKWFQIFEAWPFKFFITFESLAWTLNKSTDLSLSEGKVNLPLL